MAAAECQHTEIVMWLTKHGADSQASHLKVGTSGKEKEAPPSRPRTWKRGRTARSLDAVAWDSRRAASRSSTVGRSARWRTGQHTRSSASGARNCRQARRSEIDARAAADGTLY
jgi:hypothetical protein